MSTETLPISTAAADAFTEATGVDQSLISPIVMMGRELALRLRNLNWHRQREPNRERIESFRDTMLAGRWTGVTPIKLGVKPESSPDKYDGQHRVEALILATEDDPGLTIPISFVVHDVINDDQMGEDHFATTDYAASARSKRDIDKAGNLEEDFGHRSTILSALYRARLAVNRGLREPSRLEQTRDQQDKRRKLEDLQEFMDFYYPLIKRVRNNGSFSAAHSQMAGNSAFLAVMIFLWDNADRAEFEEFVTRLTTTPGNDFERFPDGHDPITRLATLLATVEQRRPLGTSLARYIHVVSLAWNHHLQGKELKSVLRWPKKPIPTDDDSDGRYEKALKRFQEKVRVASDVDAHRFRNTTAHGSIAAWREDQ